MIAFGQPIALLLAIPWLIGCLWFYALQKRCLTWIDDNVATRFRRSFTIYRASSLKLHMLLVFLAGLSLVLAAAHPRSRASDAVAEGGGRVLFVLDASASMYADDIEAFDDEDEAPSNRFERARNLAERITTALPSYAVGLVSFSGDATIHLPLTDDRLLVEDALHFVEIHNLYRNTGSSLSSALDAVLRYLDEDTQGLQVVLLGDGELPEPESFEDALDAVASRGIPVHAVTIGSEAGQTRLVYDFQDVLDEKEDKRVLQEYTTRRVDEHYLQVADRTGGSFAIASVEAAATLAETILRTPVRVRSGESSWVELAPASFMLFTVFFLWDALAFGYRRAPEPRFRIYALGEQGEDTASARAGVALPILLILTIPLGGCTTSRFRAHVENEKGIGRDALTQHDTAESHYLRAIGFNFRPEIPMVNLGRSKTMAEAYSEAHQHFEQALLMAPNLYEAHFNDGVALYEWGASVRDPRNCEVDRTLELWAQASLRFASAAEYARGADEKTIAVANSRHLEAETGELERYRDQPPPECAEPPPPPPEGEGEGDGGGEDDPDEDEDEDERDPPQSPPPPPPSASPPDGSGTSPPPMSPEQLQEIRDLIAGLREQRLEDGKYYRGSKNEQFSQESWQKPDRIIKW